MPIENKELRRAKLNNNQTQVINQFYKSDGQLTVHDVDDIVDGLTGIGIRNHDSFNVTKILVQNGAKWLTFYNLDELSDYYRGTVKDERKFFNFQQIQITSYFE